MQQIDLSIIEWIRDTLVTDWLTPLFWVITFFGEFGAGWIVIAVTLLCFKRTRKIGWTVGIALIAGLLLGEVFLKNIIDRPRPYTYFPDMKLLIPKPIGFSCPSGHTTSSFAAATSLYFYNKKWGAAALAWAALIGFSRMYFTVHFLTDVLFGLALGVACAFFAYYLMKRIGKNDSFKESN